MPLGVCIIIIIIIMRMGGYYHIYNNNDTVGGRGIFPLSSLGNADSSRCFYRVHKQGTHTLFVIALGRHFRHHLL